MSRPCAEANRLPWTKLPTITEAGPTEASVPAVLIDVDDDGVVPEIWSCWIEPEFSFSVRSVLRTHTRFTGGWLFFFC